MRSTIFARPNLKMFCLGAVIVVVVQHLAVNSPSQAAHGPVPIVVHARESDDKDLKQILARAGQLPASHLFAQLADHYEARGDFKKALRYLRLANIVAESEE